MEKNPSRLKIVAGNWKMNTTAAQANSLVHEILQLLPPLPQRQKIILFPPYVYLQSISEILKQSRSLVSTGGQNCHWEEKGAFTGEVSSAMLKSVGAEFVLVGHSERRQYFNESNELLSKKIALALSSGLIPVYCCGEMLAERKSGMHFNTVQEQLKNGLGGLSSFPDGKLIIAYEPVWAIGTGETATPEQAQEIHSFIRKNIHDLFGAEAASSVSILYGGSCNASNAKGLFSQPDIDGGLIGGASLKAADFVSIIQSLPGLI